MMGLKVMFYYLTITFILISCGFTRIEKSSFGAKHEAYAFFWEKKFKENTKQAIIAFSSINQKGKVNNGEYRGWPAISLASFINYFEYVGTNGKTIQVEDAKKAIVNASVLGHIQFLKEMSNIGFGMEFIDIEMNDFHPAVTAAAFTENTEVIQYYLDNGVDINRKTGKGWNMIFYAISYGQRVEVLRYLMDRGATLDCNNPSDLNIRLAKGFFFELKQEARAIILELCPNINKTK